MNRRSLLGFIILNVIVTFITVFGVFSLLQRISPQATAPVSQPLFVVVTATPNPQSANASVIVVTATPIGASGAAQPPANSSPATSVPANNGAASTQNASSDNAVPPTLPPNIPTLDPALLPPDLGTEVAVGAAFNGVGGGTAQAASSGPTGNCQNYAIKQGDTLGHVASTFGVSLDDLMRANRLKETDLTRLQIGQVLVIPLNGCGLATDAATVTTTPTKFVVPTPPPSSTVAPTASQAQIEVAQVLAPGDITSEGIEIDNISSGVIHMQGWTMKDSTGLTFNFPDYQMFPKGRVTVYSKKGTNTPVVLYWGQARAVWADPSQQITVYDAQGAVQATRPVSGGGNSSAATQDVSGGSVPTPTAGG